ncbi:hypothetical protein [Rufibacter sp. XAAS-G3-1]|uniref:hypothetical protein n=1 Tax=Rufibacter sp. XAAS-G3-1 TaxID=2729134 RepID=UPI0015E79A03|nr:hypothetical protein [Rufibacter sp. XAAS-G3-1]
MIKIIVPVLLLFFTLGVGASTAQKSILPLLFLNRQPVNISQSYSVEELKTGVVLNPIVGLNIAAIYQVRENRPVRALRIKDKADLENFELYAWGMGKDPSGRTLSSAPPQIGLQPGDRFAFDATWQGQQMSFMLKVK